MKTFLVFNPKLDAHEKLALKRAMTADDAYLVLWHFDSFMRRIHKYEKLNKSQQQMLVKMSEEFYRLLEQYEVNLDDLE